MPELPEVETLRRMLQRRLPGRQIRHTEVALRNLRWPLPEDFERRLAGAAFQQIGRRGKYLLMHTNQGCLIGHLGMSGTFHLVQAGIADDRAHNHVVLHLDDGGKLIFNDPRRFGSLHWTADDPLQHRLLCTLGPEPLQSDFNAAYLADRCRNSKARIKSVLMNARVVVGIGNIYACEALFEAGIAPQREAGSIASKRLHKLTEAVRQVLRAALKDGGTSIRDFSDADGKPGYFAQRLRVYGRDGKPCNRCKNPIRNQTIQGRSTYFCQHCQR